MTLKRFTILLITLLTVSTAGADGEDPCGQALLGQLKSREKKDDGASRVLNRIVGRVDFQFSKSGRVDASFMPEMDLVTRKKSGDGTELIGSLANHVDLNSPTAVRVEEKSVVTQNSFNEFLSITQSMDFALKVNDGHPVEWKLRDKPCEGCKFTTVTEYGRHLIFNLPKGESTFVIKSRFRKYYSSPVNAAGNLDDYKPVMGNLTALELKITTLSGNATSEFMSTPDTVFKPRIFLTDELVDRMQKITSLDAMSMQKLNEIEKEAIEVARPEGGLANDPAQVASLFKAIRLLLEQDQLFLVPTFAVKYQRASFSAKAGGSDYQMTADQDVAIYSPIADLKSSNMKAYLAERPLFKSGPGEIFLELKSPLAHKHGQLPVYLGLAENMERERVANYKQGSGKYAIARFVDQELLDDHLDRTLFSQGTQYWLIKGTSNLDSLPKKNDILGKEIEVAFPFVTDSGRTFRAQFRYKATKRNDGARQAVLDKIRIMDDFGFEIKTKPGLDDLIPRTYDREDNEVLSLNLAGTIIPFKLRLMPKEVADYQAFFSNFFTYQTGLFGGVRNLGTLDNLTSSRDLAKKSLALRAENVIHFMMDRTKRIAIGALVTVATMTAWNHYWPAGQVHNTQINLAQISVPDVAGGQMIVRGLRSDIHGEVPLQAVPDQDGKFTFTLPAEFASKFGNDTSISLHDSTGTKVKFDVKTGTDGKKSLALSEGVAK